MRDVNRHPIIALWCLVVLIAGCGTSVASRPAPPAASSLGTIATAVPTLLATPTARPSVTPAPTQMASNLTVDTVAVTVVDGLRVRSKPRVSDDSYKIEPLVPVGTALYVLGGPISASGYTWYEVAPLSSRSLNRGWVAAASRDGDTWLASGDFECPPVPTDFRSLAALPAAVGLACFARIPITVTARLISCNCDVDGAWFTPEWFSLGTGAPGLLAEPGMTRPPADVADWFWLSLDPAGQHFEVLPMGDVVEVTGIFDHPDAAGCTYTEMDGEPVPTQDCRLIFAVERLVARP